jgi:uncharacterized protein (DUF433 family)
LLGNSAGATIGLFRPQSKESVLPVYNGVSITKNPAIFSGRPIINGHRVTVHDVVVHHQAGASDEEIATGYSLAPDEVAAALAYYQEHKATIDRQIAADEREIAQRAATDKSPVAEHMRQVTKSLKRHNAQ